MIRHIIRKELLVNLLSLRFIFGLVVVALLTGLVGYVLSADFADRQQTYLADRQRHQEELERTRVYSTVEVIVDIAPSPLSVFSRGMKDRPSAIRISPYQIPSLIEEEGSSTRIDLAGNSSRPYNPLLRIFTSIDLSFVISIILSLFALLLVFDSFSGEREQGTLGLILACPVGRIQLLIGKFVGALLTMAVPLTLGFLEVMLLWSFSSAIALDGSAWAGIGLIYLVSLLFLAGFLALGLLVSLYTRESSSGLMVLLLVWVLVAVVIPEGSGYLAEYLRPQWTGREELEELRRGFYQARDQIEYRQKSGWWYYSHSDLGSASLLGTTEEEVYNLIEYNKKIFPLIFQYAEDRYRVVEQYTAELRRWDRIRNALVRPSLCVLYGNIVQAVSGTGSESYETALHQARTYRAALMGYLQPKVATPEWFTQVLAHPEMQPTDENRRYWSKLEEKEGPDMYRKIFTWDKVAPLDLGTMPRPQIEFPGLAERVAGVTTDILLLVGSACLFLAVATRGVLNYRP